MTTRNAVRAAVLSGLLLAAASCKDKKKADPGGGAAAPAGDQAAAVDAEKAAIEAENAAPVPPVDSPPPAAPKGQDDADLVVSGHISKELKGPIAMCGATQAEGRVQGASFKVDTPELEFVVLSLTDDELKTPSVILNQRQPERMSFVGKKGVGISKMERDKGVTVDAELKNIVGKEKLTIKGTITCTP